MNAYGFGHNSLRFILSYLTNRKQRMKVNNSFSALLDILSRVPQGSILGPLLFSVYINNIFLFGTKESHANYADDNTPYAIENNIDKTRDINILINWFNSNYFMLNSDKCKLLLTNHSEDISINVPKEYIKSRASVKHLGVKIDSNLTFDSFIWSRIDLIPGYKNVGPGSLMKSRIQRPQ